MRRVAIFVLALWLGGGAARAADFDYLVLALSWSPSFCASDQGRDPRNRAQCGPASPHREGWVVHGLWPSNKSGPHPRSCPSAIRDVPDSIEARFLDLLPSPRLIDHQWRAHGACFAADPEAYFTATRLIRQKVVIPPLVSKPSPANGTALPDVRRALIDANRGLAPQHVEFVCRSGNQLAEIRLCFDKAGEKFAPCRPKGPPSCPPVVHLAAPG